MKPLLAAFITLVAATVNAQENPILPFAVKIGGQEAKATNLIFATIEKPVAPDAEVEVEGAPEMLILNVFKSNSKGEVANGTAPAIILGQKTGKVRLDATMDKKKLEPGIYLANIVQADKGTSRVLFTVQ